MGACTTAAHSLVGKILDDTFRVARRLGEGGMGTVYEGIHLRLQKRVAIKVMAASLAGNREAMARFRREAEVMSAIGHPHIVQVFDFGCTPDGESYFVMELLEGEDLEQRIRRDGALPARTVLAIVKQVASALEAAHAQQIVHRDLKPANIYLLDVPGEPDFVKVLDFGISKVGRSSSALTHSPRLLGTPSYMSPEQANGGPGTVDHRTDQWALACIAWEAWTGRPPFAGHDDLSTLYRVVYEPPVGAADMPQPVESVLRRALDKEPEGRFPTVAELAASFELAVAGGIDLGISPAAAFSLGPRRGARQTRARKRTWGAALGKALLGARWRRRSTLAMAAGARLARARRSWPIALAATAAAALLVLGAPLLRWETDTAPLLQPTILQAEARASPQASAESTAEAAWGTSAEHAAYVPQPAVLDIVPGSSPTIVTASSETGTERASQARRKPADAIGAGGSAGADADQTTRQAAAARGWAPRPAQAAEDVDGQARAQPPDGRVRAVPASRPKTRPQPVLLSDRLIKVL